MSEWRKIRDEDRKEGKPFLGVDQDTGELRLTWWGKTSHAPLYGWCHGDDPEDIDLWSPTIVMEIPPPPQSEH